MHSPSTSMSAVPKPRVVAAETPRRSPVHFEGLRASNGTRFLFDVMPARASAVLRLLAEETDLRLQQRGAGPQRQDRHADSGPPAARRAFTAAIGHGHLAGAVADCAPDGKPVGERQTQIGMHPGQRRVHPVAPARRPGALSGAAGQGNPGEQGAAFVIRPEQADQAVAARALRAVEPQRRRLSPTRPASTRPARIPGREQERAAGKQVAAGHRPRAGQGGIFLAESVEAGRDPLSRPGAVVRVPCRVPRLSADALAARRARRANLLGGSKLVIRCQTQPAAVSVLKKSAFGLMTDPAFSGSALSEERLFRKE